MKFYALALMGGLCIFPAACVAARNTLETIPARRHKVHVSPLVWKTLGMLQRRGKTLHNFSADLLLTTSHPRTGETDENTGRVWYMKRGKIIRFAIHFDKLIVDGSVAQAHARHDIVFDGRWLVDRDARAKIFRKTELVPPGKVYNPLKLGQGPVPVPIGQNRNKVLHDFQVTVAALPKGKRGRGALAGPNLAPSHTVCLRLVPKIRNVYRFKRLDVFINTKLQLPVEVVRTGVDGSTGCTPFRGEPTRFF